MADGFCGDSQCAQPLDASGLQTTKRPQQAATAIVMGE